MRNHAAKLIWFVAGVLALGGDTQHGFDVLKSQRCLECHTVRGAGGEGGIAPRTRAAPDLAEKLTGRFTVPALAADLWNHTPGMWSEMSARVISQPTPSDSEWEDAFLYLYSQQIFERPGFERRGQHLFNDKKCVYCHGQAASGTAARVPAWAPLTDPGKLTYEMWNHAVLMKKETAAQERWRGMTGRDLLDITAYIQETQKIPRNFKFSLPAPESGHSAFTQHCATCHGGPESLAVKLENKTWADIAAGLWNHTNRLASVPAISESDFRGILAYAWQLQYRGPAGSSDRGERLFETKGCVSCHRSPVQGKPMSPRPGRKFTAVSMVALGWGAGRDMHRSMESKGVKWPTLSAEEVADLVAYMNTLAQP